MPLGSFFLSVRFLILMLEQILIHGYFHADPHPGNVRYLEDGRVGMIDFGLVGRLSPRMRDLIVRLTMAVAVQDAAQAAIDRARAGDGPTLIEAKTFRFESHCAAGMEHQDRIALIVRAREHQLELELGQLFADRLGILLDVRDKVAIRL